MSYTPQCSLKVANSLTDALCYYFLIYHCRDLPIQSPAFTRLFAALSLIGLNATYFNIILDLYVTRSEMEQQTRQTNQIPIAQN